MLDVPCGGGLALRGLRPGQRVRWIGVDLSEAMLGRFGTRVAARGLDGAQALHADMCALPLPDAVADLCLGYSGLHMVPDPAMAVRELARCLKPGGKLVGTTFLGDGTRRQRALFELGRRRGLNGPGLRACELRDWLTDAGIADADVTPERGFAVFRGRKPI